MARTFLSGTAEPRAADSQRDRPRRKDRAMKSPRVVLAAGALAIGSSLPRAATAGELSVAGDLSSQYWLALNEGRTLEPFAPIARTALAPEHRAGRDAAFNLRRRVALEAICQSPVLPEVNGTGTRAEAVPGADWPSLGGNLRHTGATAEPGPARGEVLWKFPVGFDYRAGPLLEGDTVYGLSPGTETMLYALDRRTGEPRWVATRAPVTTGLAPQVGGAIQRLSAEYLCITELNMRGRTTALLLIDATSGRVQKTIPSQPIEREFMLPEPSPDPRRAFVTATGKAIAVKSLKSGRTWWEFPTAELGSEPVASAGRVWAGDADGVLWVLNLDGPERVAWSARIAAAWAAPLAVAADVVIGAAEDGAVYAFAAKDGARLWRTALGRRNPRARQQFSAPLIQGGRVLVGAADGNLYCLDTATGALRWQYHAGDWIRARPHAQGGIVVGATLAGDVFAIADEGTRARPLWVQRISAYPILGDVAGDERSVFVTDNAVWLHALDAATGAPQWRRRLLPSQEVGGRNLLADAPPQIHQSPPTVRQGVVYAGGADRFLHALDARTGRLIWRYEVNGRIAAAPTIAGSLVLVGEFLGGRDFSALDARTGEPVWTMPIGGVWASPEYADGMIYVGTTEGKMFCVEAANGRTKWSHQTGSDIYAAPALDAEKVYFGSWDGHYYALDRRDGRLRWAWSPPGYPYHIGGRPDSAAAVLHEGRLIVPIGGARFVALDTHTGRERWSWRPPEGICNVTATVDRDTVFVSTFGDTYIQPCGARLYALDARTGATRWQLGGLGGLTAPVVTGEGLLIGGSLNSPYLEAYRLAESDSAPALAWRIRTGGNMVESLPAVSGGLAFFLSNDGWLRAVW
jgi:outer membrane protein assembly factor BamB